MSGLVVDATGNSLTYKIIGCDMADHNHLGPGYKEEVYERALFNECENQKLIVARQVPVEVMDLDQQIGLFYLDLVVDEQVSVEIKAFSRLLTNDEYARVINYLKSNRSTNRIINKLRSKKIGIQTHFSAKEF